MKSIISRNAYLYRPSDIISKKSISLNVHPAREILEYHNLHYNACIITILGLGTIHTHHNCSLEFPNNNFLDTLTSQTGSASTCEDLAAGFIFWCRKVFEGIWYHVLDLQFLFRVLVES